MTSKNAQERLNMSKALEVSPVAQAIGYMILFRVWYRLLTQKERDQVAMDLVDDLRVEMGRELSNELFDVAHSAFRWSSGLGVEPECFVSGRFA
jgi:hypothetical protein